MIRQGDRVIVKDLRDFVHIKYRYWPYITPQKLYMYNKVYTVDAVCPGEVHINGTWFRNAWVLPFPTHETTEEDL